MSSLQSPPSALQELVARTGRLAGGSRARRGDRLGLAGGRAAWCTWGALVALLLAGAAVVLRQTRGTVFADDEWIWILGRRPWTASVLLDPHNSHLSLVPLLIYKVLFATVGIRHYLPYLAVVTAGHLAVVLLVFVYVRGRMGDLAGILAGTLIMFFGPGWQDFLWPFQIAWLIALGAGVGALLALDRDDRRGDALACGLLGLSLASAGPGLAVAAGLVLEVLLRRPLRRLWIVGIPIVLYAAWYVGYQQTNVSGQSVFYLTRFVYDAFAGVLSSLAGLSGTNALIGASDFLTWGGPLALIVLALLIWRIRRAGLPVRLAALLTMAVVFWILTAIGRAYVSFGSAVLTATGDESRYLYIGAVLVLLAAAEALRGLRLRRWVAIAAVVVVALAVAANYGSLRDGAAFLRAESAVTLTELDTLDMTRGIVPAGYTSGGFLFGILQAGPYFQAQAALGTPASGPAQILAAPEPARDAADAQLVAIHHVGLVPAPPGRPAGGAPPSAAAVVGGTVRAQGSCLQFAADGIAAPGAVPFVDLLLPAAGDEIEAQGAAATVQVRRFAVTSEQTIGRLAPGVPALLRVGADASAVPWDVRILPGARATICSLAR